MIRLYKQKLKTAVVGEEESMNLNAFEEGEKDPLEIRDLAITAPFFAEKRMIIISDSGWFKGNHLFAEFLPELPDTTVVLFTEAEPDKSSALYKAVKEIGHVAEMNGLTDEDLMMFIGSGYFRLNRVASIGTYRKRHEPDFAGNRQAFRLLH